MNTQFLPRFVIFEGVDGVGKTTLSHALTAYYREHVPGKPIFSDSFPGSRPGTLGEWVYRFHHGQAVHGPQFSDVDPIALQLLHVAAHVDIIRSHIAPLLANAEGGSVILDRYWWSTYAYSRHHLSPAQALAMVEPERTFWRDLMSPVVMYLTRHRTLKPQDLDQQRHQEIGSYYAEILAEERKAGVLVHEIANNASLEEVWLQVVSLLEKGDTDGSGAHPE